jgi:hypothetical protein
LFVFFVPIWEFLIIFLRWGVLLREDEDGCRFRHREETDLEIPQKIQEVRSFFRSDLDFFAMLILFFFCRVSPGLWFPFLTSGRNGFGNSVKNQDVHFFCPNLEVFCNFPFFFFRVFPVWGLRFYSKRLKMIAVGSRF